MVSSLLSPLRADLIDRFGQTVEPLAEFRQGRPARIGQAERPGQSMKKRYAHDLFQRFHLMADRGGCHAHFVRRFGEAEVTGGSFKRFQRIEWRK